MKEVYGSTSEEVKMIKSIQKAMGILDNGFIGNDTMASIAEKLGADCFPVALTMYGYPTVVAKSVLPFNPKGGIACYDYTITGSFTWPAGVTPCSILIGGGKVLCSQACHCWRGEPETVIYQLKDGTLGCKRVLTIAELPSSVKWAVGGMGLGDMYNPELEGFTGDQAGVLRRTGHTVLGYKNGFVYGVCFPNANTQQIQSDVKYKFYFEKAIQLDGGSVYGYNLPGMKKNASQKYGYAIQFVKG